MVVLSCKSISEIGFAAMRDAVRRRDFTQSSFLVRAVLLQACFGARRTKGEVNAARPRTRIGLTTGTTVHSTIILFRLCGTPSGTLVVVCGLGCTIIFFVCCSFPLFPVTFDYSISLVCGYVLLVLPCLSFAAILVCFVCFCSSCLSMPFTYGIIAG